MVALLRARAHVCLALVGLLLATLAALVPTAATASPAPSLQVAPEAYIGGQGVTFVGNIGAVGRRTVHLQTHMARSGDAWTDLPGFTARTAADGSFGFQHPAPSMFGIRVRVVSGRLATPSVTLEAKSQDLVIDVAGTPRAGQPFVIEVDTTPVLPRNPDLIGLPAFPGRTLSLQQRVGADRWQTVDTARTDSSGNGSFTRTVAQPGTVVYRVRQEDWTVNGGRIGWFPSFPLPVTVVASGAASPRPERDPGQDDAAAALGRPAPTTSVPTARTGAVATASQRYRWSPALWDFAWEFGESLSSPPYRGTDRHGRWLDSSDGSGRAAKHNGGVMLDSQRGLGGPGDVGTTRMTLRGNPMRYGRWEAKMRLRRSESSARNYHALIELVPHRRRDDHCGAPVITVADVEVGGRTLGIGARARRGSREWSATRRYDVDQAAAQSFAVEVGRRHVSWFLNGRVVGTVRNRAAVPGVPLTLRLSLVGEGRAEMNKTQFISDWQRGFPISRGRAVKTGPRLRAGRYAGGC